MFKRLIVLGTTAAILTGCYHTVNPTPPAPITTTEQQLAQTSQQTAVEIKGFAFNPKEIRVKPGAKITVTNQDSVSHTLTAADKTSFDTNMLSQGQSGAITAPTKPGSYPFMCTPHPYMTGTLIVEE